MSTPSCWPRGASGHDGHVVHVDAQLLAAGGEDADHPHPPLADPHDPADRVPSREDLARRRLAENNQGGPAVPVERGEEATGGDGQPAHLQRFVGRAEQGHLPPALLEGHGLGAHHHGSGLLDLGDGAQDGPRVLEGEVVRDPAHARHAAGGLGLAGDEDH
jgi:hypothetical protein